MRQLADLISQVSLVAIGLGIGFNSLLAVHELRTQQVKKGHWRLIAVGASGVLFAANHHLLKKN